jgi:hypothetical protein
MVVQHRRAWTELFGDDVVRVCLSRLSEDDRTEIEEATAVGWVRFSALERFYDLLSAELSRDVVALHTEIVRIAVERNARTLWRALLRITSDRALMARAPSIFAKGYDRGRVRIDILEPGRAVITLTELAGMSEFVGRGFGVAVETLLTVAGRQHASATVRRTLDGGRVEVRWTP